MKKVIKHTLKYINLDSYSSSPNFLGYLNYEHGFSEINVKNVCNIFLQKMTLDFHDISIISSLFINNDKEEISKDYDISIKQIDNFLHGLLKYHIVKEIDLNLISQKISPKTKEYADELEKLETSFVCYHPENMDALKKILICFFMVMGLHGHIFIILNGLKLIVYPHTDDLGFGFIGTDRKILCNQNKYLRNIFFLDGFRFITKPDIPNIGKNNKGSKKQDGKDDVDELLRNLDL